MKKIFFVILLVFSLVAGISYAKSDNAQQNGSGNQNQNQNQNINNDNDDDSEDVEEEENEREQEQERERERKDQEINEMAEQRRSAVANAVQEMLKVANRNGGIGEQVREIAQNQNQNHEKIKEDIEKISERSGLLKFFLGPNYGVIDDAMKLIEENNLKLAKLTELKNQLISSTDKTTFQEQIQSLQENNEGANQTLNDLKKGFSILGWIINLFY